MKTNPFISVIIPERNEERYIERCLNSLTRQDYPKNQYEIIVVDGISDDKTLEIVKKIQRKYKNIRILNNPRKIVPFALNMGIKNSKGEIIVRVDGHVEIARDYLSKCAYYLKKTKADCVGGKIETIGQGTFGKAIANVMSSKFAGSEFRYSNKEGYVKTLAFGAYRKEVFDKIGLFNEKLVRNQDDEFNYRMIDNGLKIFMTPEIKSKYYCRQNFSRLFKQYFQYGLYKPRVLRIHPKATSFKQLMPFIFVSCLLFLSVLYTFSPDVRFLFYIFITIYILSLLFFSFLISKRTTFKYFFIYIVSLFLIQFGYGIGFLIGLFKR